MTDRRTAGMVGFVLYRRQEVIIERLPDGSHAMECYGCGTRFRLNPRSGHNVTVKRNGRCLVSAPILCRNGSCGWYVVVDGRGIARDVDAVAPPKKKAPTVPAFVVGIESNQPPGGRVSGAGLGIRMEVFG